MISQKIKDLTNTTNEYQREMIENTYKELEKDKTNRIEQLQKLLEQQQEDLDTEKIKKLNVKVKEVEVTVNPIDANNVIGHKRENIKKLKDFYEVDLKVKQDASIKQGKSKIEITKQYNDFLDENK